MKKFHVLDRNLPLHQHYLLEASAGTGKTFSIQNIVVRLLIESNEATAPLLLPQILVVTFTRASTRDLKHRIRSNIEQALASLNEWQTTKWINENEPDYLQALMEKGEDAVWQARKRLQQALFTFDQGQIFTIHSFCARMLRQFALESDMGLHAFGGEDPLPTSDILSLIRDFFRTEMRTENYSPAQLEIVLKSDPEQKQLLRLIQRGEKFPNYPVFNEMFTRFKESIRNLKGQFPTLNSETLIEDFQAQIGAYRNYKNSETKAVTLAKIIHFAALFDQNDWTVQEMDGLITDGLVWVKALDPKLIKGKPPQPKELHYPNFTQAVKEELYPLIEETGSFPILLARIAGDCQKLFKRYQTEEEKLSPDDLLRKMDEALNTPSFLEKVRENYHAAIIDEFQDTDPLQWKIFNRLFISKNSPWKGNLYLVGDPKQSIYSFRQADIYTYLEAAQTLGEEHCFSLDVNYRSEAGLIQGLNTLFSSDHLPHFIPLPKKGIHLPYFPVLAAEKNQEGSIKDPLGAIHFFIGDGEQFKKGKLSDFETYLFFPFIIQEITRLIDEHQFKFSQFAILVRDRHQALRLTEAFEKGGIPYFNQRGTTLASSQALGAFTDLIRALIRPRERGLLRTILGSPLMSWNKEEVETEEADRFIILFIQRLRFSLFEKGFPLFFEEMLHSVCNLAGETVSEQILGKEGGLEFYRDLQQIGDLLIDHHSIEWSRPEGIVPFLDQLYVWEANEDARLKRFQDPTADGVKILTLHYSKGLEFDVVFALGLMNRSTIKEELISLNGILTPLEEDSKEHQHFCEECDAEKMRQLYVALTRAKTRLYIPTALHFPAEKLKLGEASPLDLFLARFRQPVGESYQELYERIKSFDGKLFLEFLKTTGKENFITCSLHREPLTILQRTKELSSPPHLIAPKKVTVAGKPLWMTSYSTLVYQSESQIEKKLSFPQNYDCPIKNGFTLPAGSEIGLLLHSIFEKINFNELKSLNESEQVIPLIRPFTQYTSFKEWESVIASLVFHTLKTPLFKNLDGLDRLGGLDDQDDLNKFSLAHLPSDCLYKEMPFIIPYKKGSGIEGLEYKEGFIKGVIDSLFSLNGKFYLVDWKSNWLGNQYEDYERVNLHEAMEENSYFLQAKIYTEAMRRYLSLVEKRPFEECFGGVFYLFVRGMQIGKNTGIYYFKLLQ